jgi:hypothetical protein
MKGNMKIFLPIKKDIGYIENFFRNLNLGELVKLSKKEKPKVNEMIQKKIYRPELKDLYFLYKLITLNKRITVMEIGCGWSSLIIRKALEENKKKFWKKIKNLRRQNHFRCVSIDNEKKWISNSKKILKKFNIDFTNKDFHYSECQMMEINSLFATKFKKLPLINPDFIYLDGPDQFNVKGKIRNFTISHKDMMPMVSDLINIEYFLTPGTIILVDGRTANARFLKDNFRRKWEYKHLENLDLSIFYLNEKPLGEYNKKQLKFYNFI